MRAATRRITARYDAALAPVGVTVAQWGLLQKLAKAPEQALSIQQLADLAELERSTAARNVRLLERHGLVRIGPATSDRRASRIELAEQGRSVLRRGQAAWAEAQADVEDLLGRQEAAGLRTLLQQL